MQGKIRIENLNSKNIDDLILVCSSKRLNDPVHQQGIALKKRWLRHMLAKYGAVAKIAYYNERPVAQISYHPEEADPTETSARKNVLTISCVYNPTASAQKLGIGTRLLRSLIQDAKKQKGCLGNTPCKFILARVFYTGEFLSMSDFFEKNGFLRTPEEQNVLYFPIKDVYEPVKPLGEYKSLPEDRNKAVVFYSPACQFSYEFAIKIAGLIREVAPDMTIEMINMWEKPYESIKRGNWPIIVNAKAVKAFFMDSEKFKEEVRLALNGKS